MSPKFRLGPNAASAAVVLSAAIWGLFWVPVRYFSDNGIRGEWAIVLLYLPAFLVLLAFVLKDFKRQRPHMRPAVIVGICVGLALASYGTGILYTTVVRSTLLFYVTPVWGTLIGMFWLHEPFSRQRWLAIALGVGGLLLLITGGDEKAFNIGDALSLLSGISWAIGTAVIKRHGEIPVAGMSMFQFLFAVVFALGIGYSVLPIEVPDFVQFRSVLAVMVVTSLCMVLPAMFLLVWASQFLSPGRVGLLMMSEALVAVFSASLFLPEENLMTVQWIGAVLIICAGVVELRPKDSKLA